MNEELRELATKYQIERPEYKLLRVRFGLDCVDRVLIYITDPTALAAYETGRAYTANQCTESTFQAAVQLASQIARSHPGSSGMDGSGNATVSATNALAMAMSGNTVNAADYAAYARVYAYSSHDVTNPDAYRSEYQWQVDRFRSLLSPVPSEI